MSNKISLSKISTANDTQVRLKIDEDTVAAYAEAMQDGAVFPPVVVFHDGTDYHLADGFHRVLAANRNGFADIDAEVRQGTRTDALWYALGANATNGKRMSRDDVRKAIGIALVEFAGRSNREIAKQIGCDHKTVEAERKAMESIGEIPQCPTRTTSDGRQYPATRTPTSATFNPLPVDVDEDAGSDEGGKVADEGTRNAKTDPVKAMQGAWRSASKAERGAFLDWAHGRGSDLPKGDYKTMRRTVEKLKRIVKRNPSLRNEVRMQLLEFVGEG